MEIENTLTFTPYKMRGYIHIIIGCMYSGKSTELQRILHRLDVINSSYLVLNHMIDKRYDEEGGIITHNKTKVPCLSTHTLMPILEHEQFLDYKTILIEEAQFYPDLFEFVTTCADVHKKHVILVGLSGDYKREPFGDICRLIPHAEKITKLDALCVICNDGTTAHFTKKIFNKNTTNDQIDVGSTGKYIAVCRKHYNEDYIE